MRRIVTVVNELLAILAAVHARAGAVDRLL